jgi:hypothetical protein
LDGYRLPDRRQVAVEVLIGEECLFVGVIDKDRVGGAGQDVAEGHVYAGQLRGHVAKSQRPVGQLGKRDGDRVVPPAQYLRQEHRAADHDRRRRHTSCLLVDLVRELVLRHRAGHRVRGPEQQGDGHQEQGDHQRGTAARSAESGRFPGRIG